MNVKERLITISMFRSPDFIVGGLDSPYLKRWWLIPKNWFFNVYLHQFLRSDDDRALHDHPWWNLSWLLRGGYVEVTPHGRVRRRCGSVVARFATTKHRIELINGNPCWTLFITGPRIRDWGFWCPQGFVPWQKFTSPNNKGEIGRGCGE